jgi:hypothetical protein
MRAFCGSGAPVFCVVGILWWEEKQRRILHRGPRERRGHGEEKTWRAKVCGEGQAAWSELLPCERNKMGGAGLLVHYGRSAKQLHGRQGNFASVIAE